MNTTDQARIILDLQTDLAKAEASLEALRKARSIKPPMEWNVLWEAAIEAAVPFRQQLFALTGDAYGKPKKAKLERPSDDDLEADYGSPEAVPPGVRAWIATQSILTQDATDAVRWSRITNTLDDDRYSPGDLTLYRAVGNGDDITDDIRPGDWVTTDRAYAEDHLARWLGGKGSILSVTVDGADVLASPTGNATEAIYAPLELSRPLESPATEVKNKKPRPKV